MESPGDVRSKTTTTTTAKATAAAVIASIPSPPQSAAVFQDSSIFSYISGLSPIKPVKGTSVAQGFPGLSSPPLVFKSPRLNEQQQSHDLKRPQCHLSFQPESSRQDNAVKNIITGANEKSTSQMSSELNPCGKEQGNTSSAHDKTSSASGCVDYYLADISEIECPDSTHSINSRQFEGPVKVADSVKSKGSMQKHDEKDDKCNVLVALGASPTFLGQLENDCQGNFSSHAEPVQNDDEKGSTSVLSNLCQKVMPDFNFAQHYEQHLSEVGQSQLGKRRRLQFEEAQQKIIANDPGSWNPSTKISRSPTSPTNSEVLESSCADTTSTPSEMQVGGNNISMCPLSSSQSNRNASLTVPKRSGIGLHLNSIVRARPLACLPNVSIKSTEGSYLSGGGENSISIRSSHPSDGMNYHSSNMSLVENAAAISGDYALGSPASSVSYYKGKSLKIIEHQEAERVDEFNRLNPKKKKKKSECTDDGCKRCNCKKTKCLKLYCDCFAAGIYCAEPCACQGCFNKPEYEDTVLETRQQIEVRNPLAFAPKIIHRLSQPPRNHSGEDGDQTPLAGRHKRGCNCKKSMCLKKYCECYQANVGCSDGCRCEGCQNIYGKKEGTTEYGSSREMGRTETINDNSYDSFDDKLKMSSIMPRFAVPEFRKPHSLTHTPIFQCSEYGKDASKGHLFAGGYVPSPESDCTFYPPANSGRSPGNAANCDMILETSKENFDMVPFDQPSYVDDFSPGCHTSSNTSHLTSVTNLPPPAKDWSNSSRSQFLPGSGNFSSVSCLRWHGSPITPVALFGGTKVTDFKDKAIDIGDEDTPEMLRDSSPQPNTVKVTSPNKKRVSPPKIRLHELGSSSLRSGRKFILRAVPSFPPFTPCIDPKESTLEDTNDPPGGTGG